MKNQENPTGHESRPDNQVVPPVIDLEGLEPPKALEEVRIEEITIDGICGVY